MSSPEPPELSAEESKNEPTANALPEPVEQPDDKSHSGRPDDESNSANHEEEELPPLPPGPPPPTAEKAILDEWEPILDPITKAYYFYNHVTQETTWQKPEVKEQKPKPKPKPKQDDNQYVTSGFFNRFTGKWQPYKSQDDGVFDDLDTRPVGDYVPFDNFSDNVKAKRQLSAFFDVDAVAQQHDGRSLRAERQQQKLTKKQVQDFKKRKLEKKERNQRAFLLNDE